MIAPDIFNLLNQIDLLGGRIYPIQADSSEVKPYAIYKHTEVLEGFTFDNEQRDDHTVIIRIYDDTYDGVNKSRTALFTLLQQYQNNNTATVEIHQVKEDKDTDTHLFYCEFVATFYGMLTNTPTV